MKYVWKDLEKPINAFTVRSATMRNLNTGKVVQYYAANTKIVLVQKCITKTGTYYRTGEAAHHYLNYAFEASAFGLPNEIASLEPSLPLSNTQLSGSRHVPKVIKQTSRKQKAKDKSEGHKPHKWLDKLFRRGRV